MAHVAKRLLLVCILFLKQFEATAQHHQPNQNLPAVGIWDKFELSMTNDKRYKDPFRDVTLKVHLKSPEGREVDFWGFYDGDNTWKFRFSPNEYGRWQYKMWFDDDATTIEEGAFRCTASDIPGQVNKDEYNPFWMGFKGGKHKLFRSLHVGDSFFASNWDDPFDDTDGNKRAEFLNWLQEQGYNMLSIASHYLNRQEKGRGDGWDTPKLWPLDVKEYRKMEIILDELSRREIVVFPFAGFFGARADWPEDYKEQELYIRYVLARIGFYWNTLLSVAGPEPFWRKQENQYKGQMKWADLNRLGRLIKALDVHGHILTVHNEKRASQYGDPFIDQPWYDMGTMQGPTTLDIGELYGGLLLNHHTSKPLYAQETLWYGNKWHPQYTDDHLRKNTYTILFSGAILNFADMNGNSSTGFSGKLDFDQLHPDKHKIVHQVWDFFESIPFYKLRPRQDLVKTGYCLAKEGQEYFVYLDSIGEVDIFVDYDYSFRTEWINASDPADKVAGPAIKEKSIIKSPAHGDDWILHAYASRPEVIAQGNFPDIAVDKEGHLHIVYNRQGLRYKKYDNSKAAWLEEQEPGCDCKNAKRSDPDVVVDSRGYPVVFCGTEAARWDGKKWIKSNPGASRDTELAIDAQDNVYLCHRKGNNGGYVGLKMLPRGSNDWVALTDPDQKHKGPNDHVYADLWIDDNNVIHLVQRHGPVVEVTYRKSVDGGKTWQVETNISDERSEAPHIVADHDGVVYITTGKGYVFKNTGSSWDSLGRQMTVRSRMQPEFGVDARNNIYMTAFGGHVNIKNAGGWLGQDRLHPVSDARKIGFVETAGAENFAYIIWEEGQGNADEGLEESASIVIGKLFPDGRVIGLNDFLQY